MKKLLALLPAAALLASVPATAMPDALTPYGREDNAIGTLRWLPRNAVETAPSGQFRLVVVYDGSLNETGAPIPLKAKGAFGMKIFTTSHNIAKQNHSARVQDLRQFTGQPGLPAQIDQTAIALAGDVRDGACSKLVSGGFSQAYSTTRSFFHPGTEPYAAVSAPGTCEEVTSSIAVTDAEGNITGYQTSVTNHVPGFWIDVTWPTVNTQVGGTGRTATEVWYGAAYDSAGDPGPFPNGVDTTGASKSLGNPGDYSATYSFTANPGAIGVECVNTGGNNQAFPGTYQDIKVQVPPGSTKATFTLFPKGDWDLIVINPDGVRRVSGNTPPLDETVVAPGSGTQNFPDLVPGEYTVRACNFSGEQTIAGAVTILP